MGWRMIGYSLTPGYRIYYCEQCAEAPADTILDGDALCETCARAQARIQRLLQADDDVRRQWRAMTAEQLWKQ